MPKVQKAGENGALFVYIPESFAEIMDLQKGDEIQFKGTKDNTYKIEKRE